MCKHSLHSSFCHLRFYMIQPNGFSAKRHNRANVTHIFVLANINHLMFCSLLLLPIIIVSDKFPDAEARDIRYVECKKSKKTAILAIA